MRDHVEMDASELTRRVRDSVSVGMAYGEPLERGGVTLVPAAWVAGGGGFGFGGAEADQVGDGGGGFGVFAVPLGAFELTDRGSRFRPSHSPVLWAWAFAIVIRAVSKAHRRAKKQQAKAELQKQALAKAPLGADAAGE